MKRCWERSEKLCANLQEVCWSGKITFWGNIEYYCKSTNVDDENSLQLFQNLFLNWFFFKVSNVLQAFNTNFYEFLQTNFRNRKNLGALQVKPVIFQTPVSITVLLRILKLFYLRMFCLHCIFNIFPIKSATNSLHNMR